MYDFDTVHDRTSGDSLKWADMEGVCGSPGGLPLWVADMDFACPPEVVEAVRDRASHPIYGYPSPDDGTRESVVRWMARRHGWKIEPEWIVRTPGVVPGLNFAVRACTGPGDSVVIQPPGYRPFPAAITNAKRRVVENPLLSGGGRYRMDLDGLRKMTGSRLAGDRKPAALIFCSPHNPVGRVWKRDELEELAEICIGNNLAVVSDEIHSDLVLGNIPHTPFASISDRIAERTITLVAPNKTFNIAGLTSGCAIVSDPELRGRFAAEVSSVGIEVSNIFGNVAFRTAYDRGEAWLGELLAYLRGNLAFLEDFLAKRLPMLSISPVEGTYLAWIDFRSLGLGDAALAEFLRRKALVRLDEGTKFGSGGSGFMRLNFACPRSTLETALLRIEAAVTSALA